MEKLNVSISDFGQIRANGLLYIDKTEYLWKLVESAPSMYFLSRPRRFGKTLTVSTLKAVFEGRKELFRGLAIYDKPYDWKPYPVLHLDMANCDARSPEALRDYLARMLQKLAAEHHLRIQVDRNQLSSSFSDLIHAAAENAPAVILLDEYDKPILENLDSPSLPLIRDILADFYSSIKKENASERFVFITGVTKFCHVSLFSKLNNLLDISRNARFATMLGYTQSEFENAFREWIVQTEAAQELPHEDFLAEIKNRYDGYRFEEHAECVYNPVSLAHFFLNDGKFDNYWFATGTTHFLFELMKKQSFDLPEALEDSVSSVFFEAFELDQLNPKTLLYQTGYLTIGQTVKVPVPYTKVKNTEYTLVFPNYEVKSSFNDHLLKYYAGVQADQSQRLIRNLIRSVGSGDVDGFMKQLQVLFANIPYDMRGSSEHDYQTVIYVIFMMLNFFIEAEHRTNNGRIDLMLSAGNWTYVIEIKLNRDAGHAMKQIQNKEYALKFTGRGRQVVAVGVNFDSVRGQITDWISEKIIS